VNAASVPRRDLIVLVLLALAAGIGLWWWGMSPAARWLDHDSNPRSASVGSAGALLIFNAAWLLMTVATMLPTTFPLLDSFARVSAGRHRPGVLMIAVVGGFLGVWSVAGLAAGALDIWIHDVVHRSVLHDHAQLVAAAALLVAGAYQFTGVSAYCRRRCRSPLGFLRRHWTGGPGAVRQSLVIGADYGRSCLGCCAALMIVMMTIGMGNLGWMYLLAFVGALQKGVSWGESLTVSSGLVFLLAGAGMVLAHMLA
jgi:predicted metal-binding membrane protein